LSWGLGDEVEVARRGSAGAGGLRAVSASLRPPYVPQRQRRGKRNQLPRQQEKVMPEKGDIFAWVKKGPF